MDSFVVSIAVIISMISVTLAILNFGLCIVTDGQEAAEAHFVMAVVFIVIGVLLGAVAYVNWGVVA